MGQYTHVRYLKVKQRSSTQTLVILNCLFHWMTSLVTLNCCYVKTGEGVKVSATNYLYSQLKAFP